MAVKGENGVFAKWMMGIVAGLIIVGVPAMIWQNNNINTQLALTNLRLQTLTEKVNRVVNDQTTAQNVIKAAQLTLGVTTKNHNVLRSRVNDVEKRLDVHELRINGLEDK